MSKNYKIKSVEYKMMTETPAHFLEREAEKESKDYEESEAILIFIENIRERNSLKRFICFHEFLWRGRGL